MSKLKSTALRAAISIALLVAVVGTVGAESLAGTDGNPPSGCRKYSVAGKAWSATGCPNGTRSTQRNRDSVRPGGELIVEAECKSNPELTIVENIGDTEVFIEVLTTEYRGVNTPVEEAIGPGEEIVFETGTAASGPAALGRGHIYFDDAVDEGEEGPILITDAGEFSGDCID